MSDVSDFNLTDYLFNVSKNFNCLAGEDGSIMVANAAFCQGVNVSKYDVPSKNFIDFVHPDDRQSAITWINRLVALNLRSDLEIRYLTQSGVYEWMAWTCIKLPGQDLIYFSGRDIRLLKEREEKLNQFLTDYQKIFNSSLDVICSMDKEGNYLRLNEAVYPMWGYQPAELLGSNYLSYTHPDDKEITLEATKKIMNGEVMHNFENRFIHKNGDVRYITWSAVWSESDQIIFSIARDTTELKKQREATLLNKKRLQSLVQNGSDLIAIISPEGFYTYMSPSIQTMGNAPEDYIGKRAYDFVHPHDHHILEQVFKDITKQDKVHVPVYRFRNASGDWRWLQMVVTNCLKDPAINGFVCNGIDVTLLKEKEMRITNQNKKLMEIAQINSHVIRKPVASILGIMELINEEKIKDELNIALFEKLKAVTLELDEIIKRVVKNTYDDEGNDGK